MPTYSIVYLTTYPLLYNAQVCTLLMEGAGWTLQVMLFHVVRRA